MNKVVKGYICGLLAAVTYGLNPFFGIHLYREGVTTYSMLFYRFFFAAVLLGAWLILHKRPMRLPLRFCGFAPMEGILLSLTCIFWFLSFKIMDSGIAATILFIYPVFVAGIMFVFYREKLSLLTASGIFIALCGVTVLCKPGSGNVTVTGVIYILLSALVYAVYMVMVRKYRLRELPPDTMTFYAMLFSLPVFALLAASGGGLQTISSGTVLLNLLGLAIFPSLLSFVLMAQAIRLIGATPTSVMGALEPLTAVFIGIFVFGEKASWRLSAGVVLILSAVTLVSLSGRKKGN